MAHNKSFISEVLSRKIPQIIGMYIASVWLAVEISDWMSGRFDLSAQFSTYVFVGMMVLLPAVILLAWGHGRSGKDSWSTLEKMLLPINLIAAAMAVIFLVKPIETIEPDKINQVASLNSTENAMQKMAIVDAETGKEITYEVAKQAYHQSVISYFWDNKTGDEQLDWMSYGSSWLLSQDLKRTPLISTITPYDSSGLRNQLINKGFKKALNIPLALARKLADNRSVKWMVLGSFGKEKNQLSLTAELYNVKNGKMVKSITAKNQEWLVALDTIANSLGEFILSTTQVSKNIIPQLAIVEHTSNNIDAIKNLILALNSVTFDNDFKTALNQISQAIKKDPTFAEANVLAMTYYRQAGDFPHAVEQAKKALDLDYKLYQESVFLVKASLFGMQSGQQAKAIKVLENWVKLYPNSVEALSILGGNYIVVGNHQEQAKEVFQRLYELEGSGHKALISLGKIYRLQNNQEKAIEYLNKYLEANPTKGRAYFELADAYKQFSMFDKAKEMYEEASLYDNKNFQSEIGLANITAAQGDYKSAITQLDTLLKNNLSEGQQVNILSTKLNILLHTGQIQKVLEVTDQMAEPAKKIMPPITYTFQIKAAKIIYLTQIGEFDLAKKIVKEVSQELKPPFNKLASSFSMGIYEYRQDIENYKKELAVLEEFMQNLNMLTLKPGILSSKAKLAYWEKDYEKSLALYNQAMEITTQSFVTLLTTQEIDGIAYEKSNVLYALKDHQKALDNLEIILLRTPLMGKAHVLKAKIYQAMNDTKNRDKSLIAAHKVWNDADTNFLDYQALLTFEESIK